MAGTVSVPREAKTAAGAAGAAPGTEPPSEYPLARLNLATRRSFSSSRTPRLPSPIAAQKAFSSSLFGFCLPYFARVLPKSLAVCVLAISASLLTTPN